MHELVLRPDGDGEMRLLDLDLAERLGYERPRDIRKLLDRHMDTLIEFGICATVALIHDGAGRATPTRCPRHWRSLGGLACRTRRCAISASFGSRPWRATAASADFSRGRITKASPAGAGRHQFGSANQEKE